MRIDLKHYTEVNEFKAFKGLLEKFSREALTKFNDRMEDNHPMSWTYDDEDTIDTLISGLEHNIKKIVENIKAKKNKENYPVDADRYVDALNYLAMLYNLEA